MNKPIDQTYFLTDALDLLPDAIIIVDTEGIIIANNKQTFPLLGYFENELAYQPLSVIIPQKFRKEHARHCKDFLSGDQSRRMGMGTKLWALHKDGYEVDVDVALSPYSFHDKKYTIAVIRDISDKLKLEHTIGNLERIKEELERFGYTVSHDLKGPLQRIKMLVSLITLQLSNEKQNDVQVMTKYLNESVDSMEKLIHGILDSARMGYEEKKDSVDLNLVLEEIKKTINIPHNFSIQLKKALPNVYGNYTKMVQIFQNLITNAIKYNRKSEGLLQLAWIEDEKYYEFSFADNGIVIPEDKRHLIFRLFERASDEDGQSHGIGLFIVQNIIRSAGGVIKYKESALGGSEFCFSWPKK